MNHSFYFMAGLPRAGSTLLKSIIDQNPNVHTEPVSPVMELMYHSEQYFKQSEQYIGYSKPKNAYKIVGSYIQNYYYDVEKPIVIDHNRAWSNNIERNRDDAFSALITVNGSQNVQVETYTTDTPDPGGGDYRYRINIYKLGG